MFFDKYPNEVWFVYGLVFLYSVSYQLQSPIEIFLVEKLSKGEDLATTYGNLKTLFAAVVMISSLIFGKILDQYGLRAGFILVFLACAATFGIVSAADSMEMLYLSKIPAIFHSGYLAAQCCIIKLSKPGEERLVALGRLASSYTLGGIIGPALGGWLGSEGDYYIGARVSTATSLFAAALCVFCFPRSLEFLREEKKEGGKKKKSDLVSPKSGGGSNSRERSFVAVAALVWPLLSVRSSTSTALSMARSVQSIVLKDRLGMSEQSMGLFQSSQYAFGGFANAFLIGPVTKLLGGDIRVVVRNCVVAMFVAYVAIGVLFSDAFDTVSVIVESRMFGYVSLSMFVAMFKYSLGVSVTARTSNLVPSCDQGTLLGIEHALFSLCYVAGPAAGFAVYAFAGIDAVAFSCSALFAAALVLWTFVNRTKKRRPLTVPPGKKKGI